MTQSGLCFSHFSWLCYLSCDGLILGHVQDGYSIPHMIWQSPEEEIVAPKTRNMVTLFYRTDCVDKGGVHKQNPVLWGEGRETSCEGNEQWVPIPTYRFFFPLMYFQMRMTVFCNTREFSRLSSYHIQI